MTLKYFKGHFSLGCHFHVHFSNSWHAIASHGLPAIAELLVIIPVKIVLGIIIISSSIVYFAHSVADCGHWSGCELHHYGQSSGGPHYSVRYH